MAVTRTFAIAGILVGGLLFGGLVGDAQGFGEIEGSCEGDCNRCHQIALEEVTEIVTSINPEIEALSVGPSPVRGLWEVVIKARGKQGLAYIDFSKQFVITGSVIKVASRKNLTNEKLYELSKVDVSAIPVNEALLLGNPEARFKTIVFDDPD